MLGRNTSVFSHDQLEVNLKIQFFVLCSLHFMSDTRVVLQTLCLFVFWPPLCLYVISDLHQNFRSQLILTTVFIAEPEWRQQFLCVAVVCVFVSLLVRRVEALCMGPVKNRPAVLHFGSETSALRAPLKTAESMPCYLFHCHGKIIMRMNLALFYRLRFMCIVVWP